MKHSRNPLVLLYTTVLIVCGSAMGQNAEDRPWNNPEVPIVIDPYAGNSVDWGKVVTDKRVLAVIHKASEGNEIDGKFIHRASEAKSRGLLWGADIQP
jgi:lysozyme